jgi:hypothetical protein
MNARPKVPAHRVLTAKVGGAAAIPLDAAIKVPSLDEVWTWAPHEDHADEPAHNDQWYDKHPQERINYV